MWRCVVFLWLCCHLSSAREIHYGVHHVLDVVVSGYIVVIHDLPSRWIQSTSTGLSSPNSCSGQLLSNAPSSRGEFHICFILLPDGKLLEICTTSSFCFFLSFFFLMLPIRDQDFPHELIGISFFSF